MMGMTMRLEQILKSQEAHYTDIHSDEAFTQKRQKQKGLGIRTKMMTIVIATVSGIIVLGFASYQKAARTIRESYETSSYNTVLKLSDYYRFMLKMADEQCLDYYNNESIVNYYSGKYNSSLSNENSIHTSIKDEMNLKVLSSEYIHSIHIISDYGNSLSTYGTLPKQGMTDYLKTEEGKRIEETGTKACWHGKDSYLTAKLEQDEEEFGLAVSRILKSNKMKNAGIITVEIAKDDLTSPMENLDLPEGSYCAIITADGREITSKVYQEIATIADQEFYEQQNRNEKEGYAYVNNKGTECMYLYAEIGDTGNTVCMLIPKYILMQKADEIKSLTLTIAIIVSVIAGGICVLISNGIVHVVRKINEATKTASEGNLNISLKLSRKDELGSVSEHLLEMLDHMKHLIGAVSNVSGSVSDSSRVVAEHSRGLVGMSKNISENMMQIEQGVSDQTENAQQCVNQMEELSDLMEHVVKSTDSIYRYSEDTKDILKLGIDHIKELTEYVKRTTKITQDTVYHIDQLQIASQQIMDIVSAIRSISDQTNLLSLNASIEAARAGDAGRGFTVVAEEIRKLSLESENAVSEISRIITDIQGKMEITSNSVSEAGNIVISQESKLNETVDSFLTINQHMNSLGNEIGQIIQDVHIMQEAKRTTLAAMESIAAMMEETSASTSNILSDVEKQADTAQDLSYAASGLQDTAVHLEQSIGVFQVE